MRVMKAIAMGAAVELAAACGLASAAQHATPEDVLKGLKAGNERFASDKAKHPNVNAARREKTAREGQHPFVTLVACSDSRVPVELIFDQGIGDIFVIRVAGNVAGTDAIASIEYGVGHLHTPLLVVLGHSDCGAVTAAVKDAEVHGQIPRLLDKIKPAIAKAKRKDPKASKEELLDEAIRQNIWTSIADTFRRSEEVRDLVKAGRLMVVGAFYDLQSGKVDWLGTHPDEAKLLEKGEKRGHDAGDRDD
jgi:carbonic anhydrase